MGHKTRKRRAGITGGGEGGLTEDVFDNLVNIFELFIAFKTVKFYVQNFYSRRICFVASSWVRK